METGHFFWAFCSSRLTFFLNWEFWIFLFRAEAIFEMRHTEDKPITAIQKACQPVSRHCLSCSIEQGNLWEKNVDQSIGFGVTRNTYSAHSKFSENTQAEKMVDRTGKPYGRKQLIGHHELQAARAEEERRTLREELWRQQMEYREVHQQSLTEMEDYENSKVLPSIRSQDGSSSRTRTLLWNYQVEYKNYKMK